MIIKYLLVATLHLILNFTFGVIKISLIPNTVDLLRATIKFAPLYSKYWCYFERMQNPQLPFVSIITKFKKF